jgi:hypothetical protein
MSDAGEVQEPTAVVVVRAGAIDRFAALRATFAPDGVEVVWDRRFGERRRAPADPALAERRHGDRRGSVPPSWGLLDFIVVPHLPRAS